MRITGPGIAVEIRRGRSDDPRGEYLMLAIAGAPDLPRALQHMLQQLDRPWRPAAVGPLALPAWPMLAWLELWRAWAQAWLPDPGRRED
jgi:hypothetical protein